MRLALIAVAASLTATPLQARERGPVPVSPKGDQGSWFPVDSYPAEAKRKGEQGRVSVVLSVDAKGMPTACAIAMSSGSAALDEGTCKLAMANARFNPALDKRGKPIEANFWLRGVRWVIEDDDQPVDVSGAPATMTLSSVEIDVDDRGNGVACRSLPSMAVGDRGCAMFKPGDKVIPPPVRNDKPVASKVTMTTTMRIEPQ